MFLVLAFVYHFTERLLFDPFIPFVFSLLHLEGASFEKGVLFKEKGRASNILNKNEINGSTCAGDHVPLGPKWMISKGTPIFRVQPQNQKRNLNLPSGFPVMCNRRSGNQPPVSSNRTMGFATLQLTRNSEGPGGDPQRRLIHLSCNCPTDSSFRRRGRKSLLECASHRLL